MKQLIVNADDFGLHTKINQGIIEGYQRGCLRSTSFVAAGAAAAEAAELARENPGLGVGLHLTLVAERPVLSPAQVPSLVDADGFLWPDHGVFIKRFAAGKISLAEVRAECEAQIMRAKELGVALAHIDSHQHLHVLPKLSKVVVDLAVCHGLKKMRLPAESVFFSGKYRAPFARHVARAGLTACAWLAEKEMKRAGLTMPQRFFGMLAGGHMFTPHFMEILKALPEGVSEIMVHPGRDNETLNDLYHWQYHWEEELAAVTSPVAMDYIERQQIKLISYKELTDEQIL